MILFSTNSDIGASHSPLGLCMLQNGIIKPLFPNLQRSVSTICLEQTSIPDNGPCYQDNTLKRAHESFEVSLSLSHFFFLIITL